MGLGLERSPGVAPGEQLHGCPVTVVAAPRSAALLVVRIGRTKKQETSDHAARCRAAQSACSPTYRRQLGSASCPGVLDTGSGTAPGRGCRRGPVAHPPAAGGLLSLCLSLVIHYSLRYVALIGTGEPGQGGDAWAESRPVQRTRPPVLPVVSLPVAPAARHLRRRCRPRRWLVRRRRRRCHGRVPPCWSRRAGPRPVGVENPPVTCVQSVDLGVTRPSNCCGSGGFRTPHTPGAGHGVPAA